MEKSRLEMYLKSEDLFVGRGNEIIKVMDWLSRRTNKPVINITGPGGMGKTKFLLRMRERLSANGVIVTEIIDFYDTKNHSELGFLSNLARSFQTELFEDYFLALQDYQAATIDEKRGLYLRAVEIFYSCYDVFCNKHEVGILMDTYDEAFAKTEFSELLAGFHLTRLLASNVNIVLAGRQKIEHSNLSDKIEYLELEKFGLQESRDLFQKRFQILNLEYYIDDASLVKIVEKSDGKPIVINLAADWIIENGGTDKILSLEKEEFIQSLVSWIRDLPGPENKAILCMAVLYRRFDQELLEKTLVLKKGKGKTILENLSRFSFVKYKPNIGVITLHDEMRDYVNEYVGLPPSSVTDLRLLAVKYYERKIKKTDDIQERNSLIAEWLFNYYLLDPHKGFDQFCVQSEEALNLGALDLCNALLEEMLTNLNLNDNQLSYLRLIKSELLLAEYRPQSANNLLEELLIVFQDDKAKKCRVLYNTGKGLALRGEMIKAAECVDSACTLARELKDTHWLRKTLNELGNIYYWAGQFSKAAPFLDEVLKISRRSSDKSSTVSALGILGNVRRREGFHEEALKLCTEALQLAETRAIEIEIAHAKRNLGNVKRDMRVYKDADPLYQEALAIFKMHNDRLAIARTLSEYAWCKFVMGELNESEQLAKESIALKEKYHFNNELATTYHTLFEITQKPQTDTAKKAAYPIIEKVYELATKYNDGYMIMDSLHHLAILDRDLGADEELIKSRANEMREYELQGYYFPLFQGRVINILGNLAFDRRDYNSAIEYYKSGYKMIAKLEGTATGMSKSDLIAKELKPAQERFEKLDPETREYYLQPFRAWWSAEGLDIEYPQFMNP